MRIFLVSVVFAATVGAATPNPNSEQYTRCVEKASTQNAMHICANEEARRTDVELNDTYQKLMSVVRDEVAALEKIRTAERAWIVYRDAYIEAMYPAKDKQAAYGSAFPMEVDLLRARLTWQQTAALKDLLKQYAGSKQ